MIVIAPAAWAAVTPCWSSPRRSPASGQSATPPEGRSGLSLRARVVAGQDRLKTVANAGKLQMRPPCSDEEVTIAIDILRLQRIEEFDRAAFQRQAGAEISSRLVMNALPISTSGKLSP